MYAEKLGISLNNPQSRTHSVSSAGQMINFSVLMWSKTRAVQRVILQVPVDILFWFCFSKYSTKFKLCR